jgi:CubicO group peptidase (beta-lactamase class C family)
MTPTEVSDQTLAAVRSVIESHVARGYAPGMVALVGHGETGEALAVGRMTTGDAGRNSRPMRRDTIFRIGSMTKPIVAAATMMLIEEGTLRLDEPVDRLLPELANRRVLKRIDAPLDDTLPAKRPITVEDLLTFRCGWGIVLGPQDTPIQRAISELKLVGFGWPDPRKPLAPDEWLRRLGTLPLMAQPGEQWTYTTGSNILGVLIARASGQPLPALLEARVFGPLGMTDTAFHVPAAKRDRLTDGYRRIGDVLVRYDAAASSGWGAPPAFPAGDSGLVSTVDDVFAFARLMLQGGRVGARRLLAESSVKAMTQDRLTPAQRADGETILGASLGWGYGIAVAVKASADGVPTGAYGWNGGLGSSWVSDPRSGATAILLTPTTFDSPDPPAVHKEVWRAVFGAMRG